MSTRKYRRSLKEFAGVEDSGTCKSVVSRRLVAATARQLETLLSKRLDGVEWTALMLDLLRFGRHLILVALGIDSGGHKHVLGLWEGATETPPVAGVSSAARGPGRAWMCHRASSVGRDGWGQGAAQGRG